MKGPAVSGEQEQRGGAAPADTSACAGAAAVTAV